jgi:putative phosphoribosyl transferase
MDVPASRFADRAEAGRYLARALSRFVGAPNLLVLALPRGGVPVAFEVARALRAPLDVFVVRKLGVPFHEELAMGAVASGGTRVINEEIVEGLGIGAAELDEKTRQALVEVERRERAYQGGRPPVAVHGKTVILIDDGLATGSTMRAAIAALRQRGPEKIVMAVPTSSPETCAEMQDVADEVVCATTPEPFVAVGIWYRDFSQTTDDEVRELLARAARELPRADGESASRHQGGAMR